MTRTGARRAAAESSDPRSVREALRAGAAVTIGDVILLLQPEFPDITVSKIRFLEDQGLLVPDRTPAGYRKFASDHIDRLRSILSLQRDHFLPLRVIRDLLGARDSPRELRAVDIDAAGHGARGLDRGTAAAAARGGAVGADGGAEDDDRAWLMAQTGADEVLLAELEEHGLLAEVTAAGYDADDVEAVRAAVHLGGVGLRARHLRFFRVAADREAALVDQAVAAMPGGGASADEVRRELAASLLRLHAALVARRLSR